MKKVLFSTLMLFVAYTTTFAQHTVGSFTLQPKVGINIATLTDLNDIGKSRVDFVGGVEGEYQVSDLFSISAGLLYSRQGYKIEDFEYNGDFVTADWSPSYLNIPILANVYVVKGLAIKAGVQPGIMVGNDNVGDMANTFDFSIPVGLSYELSTVPLVLDARYNWGLTKVFDGFKPKNSVFQITIGYKFNL